MSRCVSCSAQVSQSAHFCSSCGANVASNDVPTLMPDDVATMISTDDVATLISSEPAVSPRPKSSKPASRSNVPGVPSGSHVTAARFLPGSVLAGRYRIVALLGQGGMGEVYRADDLTLGQAVALKFLPEEASQDPGLLARFQGEVRMSRRVSHPNVCRVHDVGEVEGHTFFTMEYVDGEDLASLLRRIGRLPTDKATEIARQMCAGLAAAHAKGVLHRDLKPANIMLDGRGQVVITDFGLAAFADQTEGAEIRSGTPAYMAPEQLAGKEVSEKSDLYSLGLVLYEVFTGQKAFHAVNLAEMVRERSSGTVSRPTSVVKELDPLVERVILRCLEADPANRPSSALAVAAALPGGDPLAAALAAGETPSPQMVAAAGDRIAIKPRLAVLWLAATLLGLAIVVGMMVRVSGLEKMALELPPDALAQKARDLMSRLEYSPRALDQSSDFTYDGDLLRYVEDHDKPLPQWDAILRDRPAVLFYSYRQSPRYLVPTDYHGGILTPGVATSDDPPTTQSGMINVNIDLSGRLLYFQAIPPEVDDTPPATHAVDWGVLFSAAGLDQSKFQSATPTWNSLASSDTRAACCIL